MWRESARLGALILALAAAGVAPPCVAQPYVFLDRLPDWVAIEKNIPYDRYPDTVLDILRPKGASHGNRPGMLMIHGGGWVRQKKERVVAGFCLPYLERGFVVANVEYRLAQAAPAPAAVEDSLKAVAWFCRNAAKYGVDRRRIVITGESAGAHLALMAGMAPKSAGFGSAPRVAAIVDVFGVTDVADQLAGPNARWYAAEWIPEQPGRMELARRLSPLNCVRKGLPPVLIIHGDADDAVPYDHSVRLAKALREAGVDVEMITVPAGKHGFTIPEWERLLPQTFEFLAKRGIRGTPPEHPPR